MLHPIDARQVGRKAAWCMLLLLFAIGCGGRRTNAASTSSTERRAARPAPSTTAPTPTAQQTATDRRAVAHIVQRLLRRWDAEMTPIFGDPKAAADDLSNPHRVALADLFSDDSPYVADLSRFLTEGFVRRDLGTRPGPHGEVQHTTFERVTEAADPDHLRFTFCTYNDGVGFSRTTGKATSPEIGIIRGAGDATRLDGIWRLHNLFQLTFVARPPGVQNPCPALAKAAAA